jgi:hypothetical protein
MIHKKHKAYTTDEKFILSAYQTAKGLGDLSVHLNRYEVGKLAGINPKGCDAICKLLIQANFIRKASEDEIYLTDNGERLALRLLEE